MFEDYKGVYALCAGPLGQSQPAKILKVFYTRDDCLDAASADPKYNNLEGIRYIPVPAYVFSEYGIVPYATFDDVYNLYSNEFEESSLDYDELEQCFDAGEAGVPWEEFIESLEEDGVYGEDIDVAADCYDCGQDHIAEGAEIKFTPGAEITAEDEIAYLDEERAILGESVNRSELTKDVEKKMFNKINRTENGSLNEAPNNLSYKPELKNPANVFTKCCGWIECAKADIKAIDYIDKLVDFCVVHHPGISKYRELPDQRRDLFIRLADFCDISFYKDTSNAQRDVDKWDADRALEKEQEEQKNRLAAIQALVRKKPDEKSAEFHAGNEREQAERDKNTLKQISGAGKDVDDFFNGFTL